MHIIKVSSLNVNGARNREKQGLLTEFLKLKESHVTFLQETHSDESNEADWGLCWEGSYSLNHGTNLSAGVAILFSPYFNVDILSNVELEKGRLLVVKTKIDEYNFIFVNIYAPNRSADRLIIFID